MDYAGLLRKSMLQISDFELINPKPNDVIVAFIDLDKVAIEDAKLIFDAMSDIFPNNPCLVMPDNITIRSLDPEELKQIRDRIDEFYESFLR